MFRSGPADRLPVPADRSPVPAAGRPATGRPVQVDRSTGPAAGWVAGEGGRPVAEAGVDRSTATGRPVARGVATGLVDRSPVPAAGSGGPAAGTGDRSTGRSTS